MLRIRQEQMRAFEEAGVRRFEEHLLEHLKTFAPAHASLLGDEGLLKVIRFARTRAEKYHFTNSGPIRLYAELVFILGSEFDTDPQYPWARLILEASTLANQMSQADILYKKTMEFLEATAGANREWAKESLRRTRDEPFAGPSPDAPNWEKEALAVLARIYPQKYAFVGEEAIRNLLHCGKEFAKEQQITSGAGLMLIVGMMFAIGHGFGLDPHLPWVEGTLVRLANEEPNHRAQRLYAKAMIYLDRALEKL